MSNLLPNVRGDDVTLKAVMTATGTSARSVADRFGFEYCTSDDADIWADSDVNTVFIATRNNTHAEYVLKALKAGRNVFTEKPLCMTVGELEEISALLGELTPAPSLMIGFNRRFAPLTEILKERLGEGPMSMVYRVNAGSMPQDAWRQIPEIGGGRLIDEACHFIDYLTYVNGSLPIEVYATAMEEPSQLNDTASIVLRFQNGSIGTVSYFANGGKSLPKEYVEIHRAGTTGVLDDFRELRLYGDGRPYRKRLVSQDKGQPAMMRAFLSSVREGSASPIPFEEIYAVTLATLRAVECLATRSVAALPPRGD
jgi:polar amino acid transport system substrate-binding protein